MRHLILVALALGALSCGGAAARGEMLLSEVRGDFSVCCYPGIGNTTISWIAHPAPGNNAAWSSDHPIGVPQRFEIAADSVLNVNYALLDNPYEADIYHRFEWWSLSGYITSNAAGLFDDGTTTGSPGELVRNLLTVTAHYLPPNGVSFVGTGMRFTAVEFTLDAVAEEWLGDNLFPRSSREFTVRFYGVPEPASLLLLLGLAIHLPLLSGHRRGC